MLRTGIREIEGRANNLQQNIQDSKRWSREGTRAVGAMMEHVFCLADVA
jgi:hypothetical protein